MGEPNYCLPPSPRFAHSTRPNTGVGCRRGTPLSGCILQPHTWNNELMTDADASNGDMAGFSRELIDQIFELWVIPKLTALGLDTARESVRKVLVEMDPDVRSPKVFINDDARLIGLARAKRNLLSGEQVTTDDIEHLQYLYPEEVGPNSGWICFARVGDQELASFNFHYNRQKSLDLVKRAEQFLASARLATASGLMEAAIDNAHSAAELTVQAQMMTQSNEDRGHEDRRTWLRYSVKDQRAPKRHAELLATLADQRKAARYGSGELRLKPGRLTAILKGVQEMIDFARARADRSLEPT